MFLADARKLDDDSVDIDTVLWRLSSCSNDPKSGISACFTAHEIESNDVSLTYEDIMLHFLNGQRVSCKCSEFLHNVRSLVQMALPVTEAIAVCCQCKQVQTMAFVHIAR